MATSTSGPALPILRFGHVQAFVSFLHRVGAPYERLLHEQGLALYSDDSGTFVPLHRAWLFFDVAARHEDPELGWHVGQFVGDRGLGRGLLSKLENATSLYGALQALVRMASAEASHVRLGILERPADIVLSTCYPIMRGASGYSMSQAYQLGLMLALIREFAGESWVPKEIGIEHPRAPRAVEEIFPGCRVRSGQQMGYVVVPRSLLHLPACHVGLVDDGTEPIVPTRGLDYAGTLEVLLEPYLPGGYPPARLAASLMNVSVRTLARRLSELGVTYRGLIDRARFRVARRLLRDTDIRITDVAIAVGFDDSSNFARMFRRIGGVSPREYRSHALAVSRGGDPQDGSLCVRARRRTRARRAIGGRAGTGPGNQPSLTGIDRKLPRRLASL